MHVFDFNTGSPQKLKKCLKPQYTSEYCEIYKSSDVAWVVLYGDI